jgi:predicted nucleic acid-binding protein
VIKKTYIIDSGAIIAFLFEEGGSDEINQILQEIIEKKASGIIPAINYGEILYVMGKALTSSELICLKNDLKDSFNLKIILPGVDDFEIAADYKLEGGISYADCFLLVEAEKRKGLIVTKDKEFKKFEKRFNILWI